MPKGNWVCCNLGICTPYSRKFLLDDEISSIGGEFEMVIRHDGKRIDALTKKEYQETYNFGRTREFSKHKLLDVDPHSNNPNYSFKEDMGNVVITEKPK